MRNLTKQNITQLLNENDMFMRLMFVGKDGGRHGALAWKMFAKTNDGEVAICAAVNSEQPSNGRGWRGVGSGGATQPHNGVMNVSIRVNSFPSHFTRYTQVSVMCGRN